MHIKLTPSFSDPCVHTHKLAITTNLLLAYIRKCNTSYTVAMRKDTYFKSSHHVESTQQISMLPVLLRNVHILTHFHPNNNPMSKVLR